MTRPSRSFPSRTTVRLPRATIAALEALAVPEQHKWGTGTACFWCGLAVEYTPGKRQFAYTATRDHLIPRGMGASGKRRYVLACYLCNNSRGSNVYWRPLHPTSAARAYWQIVSGQALMLREVLA